ncbi:MAG: DeoR/GlpR family DNA-binding transcription regulator [Phototrophicaceae bacterium]|jgi:DeoR/GlpR family transcriptional regulator of sugar metabolism
MPKQYFMEERRRMILEYLHEHGRVSVKDLSNHLEVSEVTIRQDLRTLEEEELLERTHGGAVLPKATANSSQELSYEIRSRTNRAEKDQLARFAANLVRSGQSIALDASTTCYRMMPYLKQLDRLIIVTNSLMVAQSCLDSPHIEVILPGGSLRRDSISVVGKAEALPDIHLNYGFFGAQGIAPVAGITESNRPESEIKQALMDRCLQVYYLLDESKWGRVAPFTITTHYERTTLITTQRAPRKEVDHFRRMGVSVELLPAL